MQWNGASRFEYDGKSMEAETTTWSEFPKGGKVTVKIHKKKDITQKSWTVRITVWGPSRKAKHLSKVIWDIITGFTRSISSTKIGNPFLMIDVKVSKDKHTCRWVDRENLIMLDKWESKTMQKTKNVIDRGKRGKTLSEVKPVENISKNLQSFLEIRPVQKEVLPLHKLQEHAYEY